MHITKLEAKKLLRDTFEPKMNQIICALEAVEAAVLAPLISEQKAQTESVLGYDLNNDSIKFELLSSNNSVTINVNNVEEVTVVLYKEDSILTQTLQGKCVYTHTSEEEILEVEVKEENGKDVFVEIVY